MVAGAAAAGAAAVAVVVVEPALLICDAVIVPELKALAKNLPKADTMEPPLVER